MSRTITIWKKHGVLGLMGLLAFACLGSAQANTTVFQEPFNSSTGSFSSSGYVYTGSYGVRMRGGSAPGVITSPVISTQGYTDISLSFDRSADSLGSGEFGIAEYSLDGGSNFSVVHATGNTSLSRVTVTLGSAGGQTGLVLRFRTNSGSFYGKMEVKNLVLSGSPAGGGGGGDNGGGSSGGSHQTSMFNASYQGRGSTSSCNTSYAIRGYEPSSSGTFPLFIYTVGTGENYLSDNAISTIQEMAARGYVAATVNYSNSSFGNCSTLSSRANCIYNGNNGQSAVAQLCARGKADCSKGIVVAGLSQGSIMAVLARNYDNRVRAAYGQAIGVKYSIYDLSSCVANGNRSLPSNRLRAVTGAQDGFMGSSPTSVRNQLRDLTGINGGAYSYTGLNTNGSGWYMVANAEVDDGNASHCYMFVGGCTGVEDSNWRGNQGWSLDINLDWLQSFTD